MMPPTLVLSPRYTADSIALAKAAANAGWPVERLTLWHPSDALIMKDVAVYGEPFFAAAIAEQLSLYLLEPPFDWLTTLPTHYASRRVWFGSRSEARQLGGPTFIKPADDKCFTAQVYDKGTDLPDLGHLPEDTPILFSEPVAWEVEYRGFIRDRQLLTLSPYFRNGSLAQAEDGEWPVEPEEVEEAFRFYSTFLRDEAVALPPAVVVDVGRILGCGWAVVEANPAWSSGIYGCDPAEVLQVVEAACLKQSLITDAEKPWIINRSD